MKKLSHKFVEADYLKSGIKLLSNYINSAVKNDLECLKFGHKWQSSYNHFHTRGDGCPECNGNLNLKHTQKFVEADYLKSGIKLLSNYINSAVKNDLECLKFGHKWQARYNDFRFDDNGCPECYLLNSRGENSPHWNHELTNEDRENSSNRNRDPNTRLWVKAVLDRDNHTCQCCNSRRSLTLIAHHIDSWKEFKSDRFNVDNGVTLCENCHKAYHKRWGKDKANHNSFYFWMAEQSTVNPSKWLWSVRYFESMNEWLEYFKRQLI